MSFNQKSKPPAEIVEQGKTETKGTRMVKPFALIPTKKKIFITPKYHDPDDDGVPLYL